MMKKEVAVDSLCQAPLTPYFQYGISHVYLGCTTFSEFCR